MTTALAVIDMQEWVFREPQRAAKLPGLIAGVNRALVAAETYGWPVYEIRTEWPHDRAAWSLRARKADQVILQAGSRDVVPAAGLCFPAHCEVVVKTRHSAFLKTDLEDRLNAKQVTRLLLAGCWLDGCVTQTAIDAYERNIETMILADAVASIDDVQGEFARRWANHLGDIPCVSLAEATGH
jgi:nicotinamidase-related amidase